MGWSLQKPWSGSRMSSLYYCIYTLACSIKIRETASSVMHSGPHVLLRLLTVWLLLRERRASSRSFYIPSATAIFFSSVCHRLRSLALLVRFQLTSSFLHFDRVLCHCCIFKCMHLVQAGDALFMVAVLYIYVVMSLREWTDAAGICAALTLFYLTSSPPTQHFTAIKSLFLNDPTSELSFCSRVL